VDSRKPSFLAKLKALVCSSNAKEAKGEAKEAKGEAKEAISWMPNSPQY
jgi:hypothetical protein